MIIIRKVRSTVRERLTETIGVPMTRRMRRLVRRVEKRLNLPAAYVVRLCIQNVLEDDSRYCSVDLQAAAGTPYGLDGND